MTMNIDHNTNIDREKRLKNNYTKTIKMNFRMFL